MSLTGCHLALLELELWSAGRCPSRMLECWSATGELLLEQGKQLEDGYSSVDRRRAVPHTGRVWRVEVVSLGLTAPRAWAKE